MRLHIDAMRDRPLPGEKINHFYKPPSVDPAIRYLHALDGFPTKTTWLKAIRKRKFSLLAPGEPEKYPQMIPRV